MQDGVHEVLQVGGSGTPDAPKLRRSRQGATWTTFLGAFTGFADLAPVVADRRQDLPEAVVQPLT
jgi:hypothetical protein